MKTEPVLTLDSPTGVTTSAAWLDEWEVSTSRMVQHDQLSSRVRVCGQVLFTADGGRMVQRGEEPVPAATTRSPTKEAEKLEHAHPQTPTYTHLHPPTHARTLTRARKLKHIHTYTKTQCKCGPSEEVQWVGERYEGGSAQCRSREWAHRV